MFFLVYTLVKIEEIKNRNGEGFFMKRFVVILVILMALLPSMAHGQAYDTVLLDELVDSLVNFSLDPEIGIEVRAIQPRLSFYREYLTRAFSYRDTFHIDVLLQYHGHFGTPEELALIVKSQEVVCKALENRQIDVIADEGTDLDSVTFKSLFKHAMEKGRELGYDPDSASMWETVLNDTVYDGVTWYMKHHPRAHIIGSEEYPLLVLSSKLQDLTEGSYRIDSRYYRIDGILLDLRSDIALAKLITALHRKGRTQGALNIGLLHERRIGEVLERLGISHTLIRTLQ